MMTVNEVSRLAGISVRTLQYYDKIGLLHPSGRSEAGYRLYEEKDLSLLQQILLFRELEFPLKEIKEIIHCSDYDREKALQQQIELLTLKKEHLENLISYAEKLKKSGGKSMDFKPFDKEKMERYAKEAKETWGKTDAYKEYEEKSKGRTERDTKGITEGLMELFVEFGQMKEEDPASQTVQKQVEKLQAYITEHFYNCTKEILAGLGQMYGAGGEFTENIDKAGGEGCAEFAAKAISIFCR